MLACKALPACPQLSSTLRLEAGALRRRAPQQEAAPVLRRRRRAQAGELVAQFKATVLLMPNGSDRITAAPLQTLNPGRNVEDAELKKLLAGSCLKSKKKAKPRKGKEKKKANGAGGEAGGADAEAGGAAAMDVDGGAAPAAPGEATAS